MRNQYRKEPAHGIGATFHAVLPPVPGFRDAVLRSLPSGTPQAGWTDADYAAAARRRVAAARQRLDALGARPATGLEIGCGAGLDCLVAWLEGVPSVTGIDRDPPLLATGDEGGRAERALRLLAAVLELYARNGDPAAMVARSGVDIRVMDATQLELPDASVDAVWSRTALEHVQPVEQALDEVARVLRPGGVAHHVIDPFFWLKGCHARGLTDLPWAHARLELDDYEHFVHKAESRRRAQRRTDWLRTLNRFSAAEWRHRFEADDRFELLSYADHHSPVAEAILADHPEVVETLLPGLTERDLTCCSVEVLVRRRSNVQPGNEVL
jgi:SAM-dependent methyltransferase